MQAVTVMENPQSVSRSLAAFKRLSTQLNHSCQNMEAQLSGLEAELAQVNLDHHQNLKEKEHLADQLEKLLAALPAAVIQLDSHGHIITTNAAADSLFGVSLIGRLWRDVIEALFSPVQTDPDELMLTNGKWITINTCSLSDGSGQLILAQDCTENRRLRQQIGQQNRLSELGRMMASLAHQIRTPLSAAKIYCSHMQNKPLDSQQYQRFAGKVMDRIQQLEKQLNDMLLFARSEIQLNDVLTISELFQCLENQNEPFIDGEHHRIELFLPQDVASLSIACHQSLLLSALQNLVNNAFENEGAITVALSAESSETGCVEFRIRDNGPGMDEETLAAIRTPFYTTKPTGTGLGLAVVSVIVTAHGGQWSMESSPGRGTCVTVKLPLIQNDGPLRKLSEQDEAGIEPSVREHTGTRSLEA